MKRLALLALLSTSAHAAPPGAGSDVAPKDPLAPCLRQIDESVIAHWPGDPFAAGATCLLEVSANTATTERAVAEVKHRLAIDPEWAELRGLLAALYARDERPETPQTYHDAIADLALSPNAGAEVSARMGYADWLARHGESEASDEEFERALVVTEHLGDWNLHARVLMRQAAAWGMTLHNLGGADAQLREVLTHHADDLGAAERMELQTYLGYAAFQTGRHRAAATAFTKAGELAAARGDDGNAANNLYNAAVAEHDAIGEAGYGDEERVRAPLRRALALAERLDKPELILRVSSLLAEVVDEQEARALLERCVALRPGTDSIGSNQCARTLANLLVLEDEDRARTLLERAGRLPLENEDHLGLVYWAGVTADALRKAGHLPEATGYAMVELDGVEALGLDQGADEARARVTATWAGGYYQAAGSLLREAGDDPEAVALAFNVIERSRAQSLRESLRASGAQTEERPRPPVADIAARYDGYARAVQNGWRALVDPSIPDLDDVQRVLGPDEALLSYQLAERTDAWGDDAGGAWLTVVTRDAVQVVELADGRQLENMVEAFVGIYADGRTPDSTAARSVTDAMLPGLLEPLSGKRSWIVVADGALHRLPFAALLGSDGRPLVTSHAVSAVPSAATLVRWREDAPPRSGKTIVLADPTISDAARALTVAAAPVWAGARSVSLTPLPSARREAEAVADRLHGNVVTLLGDHASTAMLREHTSPAIVHFATHALIDPEHPNRTGIVVAPTADDDGLLSVSEIVDLPLRRSVVVLAACSSAAGLILRGEGVMGLTRGFLEAGAHTVVASLWPLSDAEAAEFFESFYAELADGASVGEAVAATQRAWIEAERSPRTWASIVVLGDPTVRPLADSGSGRFPWVAGGLVAALALLAAVTVRQRAAHGRSASSTG